MRLGGDGVNASSNKCPKCGKQRVSYKAHNEALQRAWRLFLALAGRVPLGSSQWCHFCSHAYFQEEGKKRQKKDDESNDRCGENKASLGPFRFGTGGGRRVIRSRRGLS